jgi:hypothetical protein
LPAHERERYGTGGSAGNGRDVDLRPRFDGPLATIVAVAGPIFVGVGAVGKIAGRVEVGKTGRIAARASPS